MTSHVHCNHLAGLGTDLELVGACADPACPTPLSEGPWTFAGPTEAFRDVLAELADGRSLAGALLLVGERRPPGEPLLLADGEQVAAVASRPGVRVRTLGGGAYVVATGPVDEPAAWTEVPAGTVLLLDPCGITTTTLTGMSRIFTTSFASVYPHYMTKVEKKGRTKAELDRVIEWLTGFDESALSEHLAAGTTFADFFAAARLNPHASSITGVVCGVRVEDIEDPLMQKIRYLDKLVDELARGKAMDKVLRA